MLDFTGSKGLIKIGDVVVRQIIGQRCAAGQATLFFFLLVDVEQDGKRLVTARFIGLTLLASVVVGVVPGLKATGPGVHDRLNRATGGNGMQLGGIWTALIVAQVGMTVAFLPFVSSLGWQLLGIGLTRPAFEAEDLVAGHISGAFWAMSPCPSTARATKT